MCKIKKVNLNSNKIEQIPAASAKLFQNTIKNAVDNLEINVFNEKKIDADKIEKNIAAKFQKDYEFSDSQEFNKILDRFYIMCGSDFIEEEQFESLEKELQENNISLEEYGFDNTEMAYYYILAIDNQSFKYDDNGEIILTKDCLSIEERIYLAHMIMEKDKKNDYEVLYSTAKLIDVKNSMIDLKSEYAICDCKTLVFYNPNNIIVTAPLVKITKDSSGNIITKDIYIDEYNNRRTLYEIIGYYSDIMKSSNKYTDKFRDKVFDNLNHITIVNTDYDHFWAAFCCPNEDTISSDITMDLGNYINSGFNNEEYEFMVDSFTHECGHAYANATSYDKKILDAITYSKETDFDETKTWKQVYEQINKNDPNHTFLRDYAHKDPEECFAECVTEYFGDPNDSTVYNPNDLKSIDITIDGKTMTLYDYMDNLLN